MADVIEIVVSQGGPQGPAGPVDSDYTDAQLAALKAGVGASRDTLKELSDAIDASGATSRSYTDQKVATLSANVTGLRLVKGAVTKVAPGGNPDFALTGTGPVYGLDLSLVTGDAGAGAPNSADILAIDQLTKLGRSLSAAGITEEPSLVLDFVRGVHFASKAAIAATLLTLVTAIGGISAVTRSTVGTYWGSDGLLKTAAINVPREEYDPLTRAYHGFLIESVARTNTIVNNVGLASAQLLGATQTTNVSASPDGTLTMSRFTSTVAGGSNTAFAQRTVTIPNDSLTRTFSAFLRPGNTPISSLVLFYNNGGTSVQVIATIDWSTKTISGGGSPVLRDLGGGLYRASVTFANNGTGNTNATCRVYCRDQGSANVIGDYVDTGTWQLEEGSAMSSPIVTGASAVTRGADTSVLAAGQWLTGLNLTAMLEVSFNELFSGGSAADLLRFVSSAGSDSYRMRQSVTLAGIDFLTQSGGVSQVDTGSYAAPLGTVMRLAFAIDATNYAYAKDNVLTYSGVSGTPPAVAFDRLVIGSGFMGHLRRLEVWPQRLSNAKVQIASNQVWG